MRKYLPRDNRLIVVLSHIGYESDVTLAQEVPEIDVIVGGHQHAVLQHPHLIGSNGRLPDSLLIGNKRAPLPGCIVVQA
ncbi:MAG: hypothetical protein P9X24_14130 [Candidatus Hatepunaea meridiana]|nr:hypothetical protein [Candidatus Hatepunaea meridiana]